MLRELAEADVVLCEDTRHTRVLLERHGIEGARCAATTSTTRRRATAELLPRLEAGERIALVSDAGLPGVNDPGARLIAAALEAGVPVTVLPGPSAVETALVASGLVGERYQFLGYLPRGEKALAALWDELGAWPHPAVAFESPERLPATLRSLAGVAPDRPVAVCRELTKRFEEVVRGDRLRRSRSASRSRRRARSRSSSGRASRRGGGGGEARRLAAVASSSRRRAAAPGRRRGRAPRATSRNTLYAESLKSR